MKDYDSPTNRTRMNHVAAVCCVMRSEIVARQVMDLISVLEGIVIESDRV